MAPNDSAHSTGEAGDLAGGRRKAVRYLVPLAVAGVAAGTIGLVPALASSGDPDLPKITAQELIEKIAASDTQQLSGTVRITTDLGLPSFDGLAGSLTGAGGDGDGGGSSADPSSKLTELASGTHTVRVAADGPDRQKVSVLEDSSEYSLIRNGDEVWAYDSASNEVFHSKDAAGHRDAPRDKGALPSELPTTPKEFADEVLKASADTTSFRVGGTAQVAGRDAYRLVVEPKQKGSTVKAVTIAVDAETGTPLKVTLTPGGGGKAVVDAGFTKVDFARPAASTFDFTPPKGAQVTEADEVEKEAHREFEGGKRDAGGFEVIGEGWTAIATIKGAGGPVGATPDTGELPPEAGQFLDSLGDKVTGKFGKGTVFSTRLVNALMTEDGTVYVGAVTKDALVKAADAAK
ncbi:outer membrane lipoprotein carrier protein LolA [Streptomyces zhihengii]|uniref:Outer membrane lipoprotein carrier protein LolA n=1 Tax=Streptomyces zhihengii TaxID=1818004 RepID=A0ABS2UR61_9ACTN|nr:sigma-E factor regulatory protein RseB domain-containing protein [Streptomyces zhihengii]MBM9619997.1 outer membrane lipoprotein carrier protein LolA [Streptomyces zhihengii]